MSNMYLHGRPESLLTFPSTILMYSAPSPMTEVVGVQERVNGCLVNEADNLLRPMPRSSFK